MSGKSTIAKEISKTLEAHLIDIDDVRFLNFGPPNPNQTKSEEREIDKKEMFGSYELLLRAAVINLALDRSLIITATFSRETYWDMFRKIVKIPPNVCLKIISCEPQNDSEQEIRNRLTKRTFGKNTWSAVNSFELYEEVKNRYQSPNFPHLKLDTSPPNTVGDSVKRTLTYINS